MALTTQSQPPPQEADHPGCLQRRLAKLVQLADLLDEIQQRDPDPGRRYAAEGFRHVVRYLSLPWAASHWLRIPESLVVNETQSEQDAAVYRTIIEDLAQELDLPTPMHWPHLLFGVFADPKSADLYLLPDPRFKDRQRRLHGVELPPDIDDRVGVLEARTLRVQLYCRPEADAGFVIGTAEVLAKMPSSRWLLATRKQGLKRQLTPLVKVGRKALGRELAAWRLRVLLDPRVQRSQSLAGRTYQAALPDDAALIAAADTWDGFYRDHMLLEEPLDGAARVENSRPLTAARLTACITQILLDAYSVSGPLSRYHPLTGRRPNAAEHALWWYKRVAEGKSDAQIADELGRERPEALDPNTIHKARQRRHRRAGGQNPASVSAQF